MDTRRPDPRDVGRAIVKIGIAGSRLSIKLTTLASQNARISGRATAIANDTSLVANLLFELDNFIRKTVRGSCGEIGIVNGKGMSTISTHSETCKKIFETIDCEVDSQLNAKSSGERRMHKAAEDSFTEQRMDRLRLELKEAKEALMLVLQVVMLARHRVLSETDSVRYDDLTKWHLAPDEESLLKQAIRAKVSSRKPLVEDSSPPAPPSADSANDTTHSQADTLHTADQGGSGSTIKSPLDTSTTLAPSEDELEQIQTKSGPSDENVGSTAQKDDCTYLSNVSQTRDEHQKAENLYGKTVPLPEVTTTHSNERSSFTQPQRPRIPYLKRDGMASTRPGKTDWPRDREADERSLKSAVVTGDLVGTPRSNSISVISRSQSVSCLTVLKSLLSRRSDHRPRAEWIDELVQNMQQRLVLNLVIMRPYIKFTGQGYFVGWSNLAPVTEQQEIAKQLVSNRRKDSRPVTEQVAQLSITQSEVIGGFMKAVPEGVLLSISTTLVDLEQDGMKLRGIPETRFIFRHPRRDMDPRRDPINPLRPRRENSAPPEGPEPFLPKETYLKTSLEFLDPRTLNAFRMPWEFDPVNQYAVIIKKYLTVDDQDVLFEHTKKVRRHDLFRAVPSKPLKGDGYESPEDHGKVLQRPSKAEVDLLFLRVDSRKELEEENKTTRALPVGSKDSSEKPSSPSDRSPGHDEEGSDVVELLLAKYTTLFEEMQRTTEPEWVPL